MTDEELAQLSASAALKRMLERGSFCICTMRTVAQALGRVPDPAANRILEPLHCVSYADMPPALRQELPALMGRYLQIEWPPRGWDQPASVQPGSERTATPRRLRLFGGK